MPKISRRRRCSNRKSHIQRKQQSTREDIEKDISSSIGEKNISVEDDSCMDIDNDIETNLNSDVECEEINDVDEEDDNDDDENEECDVNDINEGTSYRKKKFRKKTILIQTLISAGNFEKQCDLLKSFLSSPELKEHVKMLRIYQPEDEMKIESFDNLAKVMSLSSPKKKKSLTNETKCFQDCVISTIVPTSLSLNEEEFSPENNETSTISRKHQVVRNKMFAEYFDMSKRSVQRKVKRGEQKRNEFIESEVTSFKEWLKVPMKKGFSKITPSVISALNDWIFNHDNVIKSSHMKDTMKIKLDLVEYAVKKKEVASEQNQEPSELDQEVQVQMQQDTTTSGNP